MSKRAFSSLADLAKILEEAVNPESTVREDRQRPKVETEFKASTRSTLRNIDPKRKAWYAKRLKEQAGRPDASSAPSGSTEQAPLLKPETTRSAATRLGANLLQTLAAADSKQKAEPKKPEPWRRKPGDPIF